MRTLLSTVFIALLAACGGSSKAKPDAPPTPMPDGPPPTANGVFPAQGFAGRTLRVEVTGDQTTWTSSTTVSFGSDLTTANVAVASPTDLFVDVTIPDGATIGLHDVTVTNGSEMYTLKQAFEVDLPTTISTTGTLAQGSVLAFTIKNLDTANLFDTTCGQTDPFTGQCLAYTNISTMGPNGVYLEVSNVTDFEIDGTMLIDVNAAAGPAVVTSGPTGSTIDFPIANIAVANRTATALASGSAVTGNVGGPLASQLYMYTPSTGPDLVSLALSTTSTTATLAVVQLGSTGSFTGPLTYGPIADSINATPAASYYIYWDNSGASGYSYSLTATDTVLTTTTHLTATENTTTAAPLIVAPGYADMGSIALMNAGNTANVGQWMKVAVASGKTLRVVTQGNINTDTEVLIYDSVAAATAGTAPVATCDGELNPSTGAYESLNSDCTAPTATVATGADPAGTWYVNIKEGSNYDGTDNNFTAAIVLQ